MILSLEGIVVVRCHCCKFLRLLHPQTFPPDALYKLQVILSDEKLSEDVDVASIASRTDGYSGSDLRQVCTAAAMRPVRDLLKASTEDAKQIVSYLP